jgi:tight adherence protein B
VVATVIVFIVVTGLVAGLCFSALGLSGRLERKRLERRLNEVAHREDQGDETKSFLRHRSVGPLPALDKVFGQSGSSMAKLIEQSGVSTTPSAIILYSIVSAVAVGLVTMLFVKFPFAWALAALFGFWCPTLFLKYKRSARLKKFEEQFPEALDLLSRAIRAGHAFQTAMGMCADELPAPVGVEFKKSFDQQNFGLPLKDALNELAVRVPILDVRFFVTAVSIQRETGGNLSEILDNLAHVVRERFKILRQVRVHTAHGRFTGWVLLSLPAALAFALTYLNPGHMDLLFKERMGQMMILGAIIMQTIGYIWIRKVIKIEV